MRSQISAQYQNKRHVHALGHDTDNKINHNNTTDNNTDVGMGRACFGHTSSSSSSSSWSPTASTALAGVSRDGPGGGGDGGVADDDDDDDDDTATTHKTQNTTFYSSAGFGWLLYCTITITIEHVLAKRKDRMERKK
jgi:hypothetical protein